MVNYKQQSGFTLMELTIVIVLLGILSVTVASRFVDYSSSARKAQVSALEEEVRSASERVFYACQTTPGCMKAAWGESVFLPAFNMNVRMLEGYVDAGEANRTDEIDTIVDSGDFDLSFPSHTTTIWSVADTSDCYVEYIQKVSGRGTTPTINSVDTGC